MLSSGSKSRRLGRLAGSGALILLAALPLAAAPDARAQAEERDRRIRDTLDSLPESMNLIIQLVYYQGMKYREAAEVLDIPVGTVKSRMHAAIARLTEQWSELNRPSD